MSVAVHPPGASHPLCAMATVVVKLAGVPDVTVASWLATTTPLCTSSNVPVKFWFAVHCNRHRHVATTRQVNLIPRRGVAVHLQFQKFVMPIPRHHRPPMRQCR